MADETEILEEEDPLTTATEEDSSAFAEKLLVLKSRCDAARIEFAEHRDEGTTFAIVSLPKGKQKRRIAIFNERRADALLGIPFEKYRFIAGYEAICCYEDNYIEAALRSTRLSPKYLLRQIRRRSGLNAPEDSSDPIEIRPAEVEKDRPILEIGPPSIEFDAIDGPRSGRLTLKLKGARATQHDHALSEIRSYADSLFFQIDMVYGSTFTLDRERSPRFLSLQRRQEIGNIEYPRAHYNGEAMSLYWYAKVARDMPLLRFLAFYQSIEFYFPRYTQIEARKRVSAVLKQPTFRIYRDDDLDRLISAIHVARSGGPTSERAQLRSAISACLSPDDVRDYVSLNKEREEHFSGRAPKTRYHKIPISNKSADLRNDIADRIYDIRCKIVHTKNEHTEDEIQMILPFSDDADYLNLDIDLVEFIARSVLVASSDELI